MEFSREMKNRDGSIDKVIISSDDNYKVKLNKKYVLVGYAGNKYVDAFKNSILGMEVGLKSYRFGSTILISTIIAVLMYVGMYFLFRI